MVSYFLFLYHFRHPWMLLGIIYFSLTCVVLQNQFTLHFGPRSKGLEKFDAWKSHDLFVQEIRDLNVPKCVPSLLKRQ